MIQLVLAGYVLLGGAALAFVAVSRLRQRIHAARAWSTAPSVLPRHPDVVFTLVHGTWGQRSRWTGASSPLSRALLRVGDDVALVPFVWSGGNWASSRRHAAERLRAHLAAVFAAYPQAAHYVIAHSHGGNIALYALRHWEPGRQLSGLVCLSTPFLCIRRRSLGPIGGSSLAAGLVIGPWLAAGAVLPRLGVDEEIAIAASLPVIGLGAWALVRWSKRASDQLLNSLALPERPPVPTLIIRAPGDEAGAALSSVHFLSWVVSTCWVRPAQLAAETADVLRAWGARARALRGLAAIVIVICVAGAAVEIIWHPLGSLPPSLRDDVPLLWWVAVMAGLAPLVVWWLGTGAGLYGYALGFTMAGLLLAPFILLLVVCVAPFGPDLAASAVPLEISAEPTPPGTWVVHQLTPDASRAYGLKHSSYDQSEAIDLVARWIRGTRSAGAAAPRAES